MVGGAQEPGEGWNVVSRILKISKDIREIFMSFGMKKIPCLYVSCAVTSSHPQDILGTHLTH